MIRKLAKSFVIYASVVGVLTVGFEAALGGKPSPVDLASVLAAAIASALLECLVQYLEEREKL